MEDLVAQLRELSDVDAAEVNEYRAIDPVALTAWVNLAVAAIPVVTALVNAIRAKKLHNVRIKTRAGTISIDSASSSEIADLVKAMAEA